MTIPFPRAPGLLVPLVFLGMCGGVQAQDPPSRFGRSVGGQVILANSGFGLGAHLRLPLDSSLVFSGELDFGTSRDAREVSFVDPGGRSETPNKANYLIEALLLGGAEMRVFRRSIKDNFRPFVLVAAGPTLGWLYPYFDDVNENGVLDEGEQVHDALSSLSRGQLRPAAALSVAVGAHFGGRSGMTQGVRIGYRLVRYFSPVQLLEPAIRGPQRLFGTPVILVYLGRLF